MNGQSTLSTHWLRNFIIIWIGQAFSLFGSLLVQFSLVWWLTRETGSATVLATATLAGFIPMTFLGPFAGAIVDRYSHRAIMILSDTFIALTTLVLVLIAAYGVLAPWHIYLAMFIRSLGQAFHGPAMQSSTTLMVPEKHFARVAGINQALAGAMNIIAPPSGALLIGAMSLHWVLSIDILTAILGVLPLLFIAIPQPQRDVATGTGTNVLKGILADTRTGFAYIYRWKGLFYLLLWALLINVIINPAFSLLPLLVYNHFGGSALDYGSMESALGIGIVAGGIALGVWGGFKRNILTSALGIAGMGLGCLALGLAPGTMFWLALAGVFVIGLMNPITNGPIHALIQSKVEPAFQGRVMTVISSIATGLTPLALLVAGPLADRYGIQTWFIMGGFSCLVIPFIMVLNKSILRLDEQLPAAPETNPAVSPAGE